MDLPPEDLSTVEDFLENDEFRTWIRERHPEDQVAWQQWLLEHPEKVDLYEQAVAVFLTLQGKTTSLSDQQVKDKTRQILDQLPESITVVKPLISWHWERWVAAASLLLVLIWWQSGKPTLREIADLGTTEMPVRQVDGWKVVKNITDQSMTVLLPEKSSVLLSASSQIRFRMGPTHDLREVYLQGEGFFEVAKNPAKPFIVYTNRLTTRVTGTSFQIRSFADESDAFVKVKTGKVMVTPVNASGSSQKEVLLAVNQQLSLDTKTDKVEKKAGRLLEVGVSGDVVNQSFAFDFTPVPEVLSRLEATYHMPIVYDRNLLKNCTFTGQLNDVPFLEKIRLVCQTIESSFSVENNQIIIQSAGCN